MNDSAKPRQPDQHAEDGNPSGGSPCHGGAAGALAAAEHAVEQAVEHAVERVEEAVDRVERDVEEAIDRATHRPALGRRLVAAFGWTLTAAYFSLALFLLVLRYWALPNIGQFAPDIERVVSQAVGTRVTIGRIDAGWHGLRPELQLSDVRIHDRSGEVALSLPAIEAEIAWRSMLDRSVVFHSLVIDRADLDVSRDAQGRLFIAGLEMRANPEGGKGAADWLLGQNEVRVRDARITWTDARRSAPPLVLAGVTFLMHNDGEVHRFALRAQTALELASALELRGELTGSNLTSAAGWTGRLFAELDYTDLTAWQRWFDYPIEVRSGKGAVRVWLGFTGSHLAEAVADVSLSGLVTRIAPELPLLELEYLRGRLAGKHLGNRTEVSGRHLALRTQAGVALPAADFSVKLVSPSGDAPGATPPGGEITANSMQLEPLARIVEFLPVSPEVRKRLGDTNPSGRVSELRMVWSGVLPNPANYSVRARFEKLAARANAGLPGFSGLTGQVEASDRGGQVTLASQAVVVDLPQPPAAAAAPGPNAIQLDPRYAFDSVGGQVVWTPRAEGMELRFSSLALANREMAATISGSYGLRAGARGVADLSATVSRADATAIPRYLPVTAGVRDYLRTALLAGRMGEGKVRLRGDLAGFPFADAKAGQFQVEGRFRDTDFRFADRWPKLEAVGGLLLVDGRRMEIRAQRAQVMGARITQARADVPDLFAGRDILLRVEGEAQGNTQEFLRFIDASPVGGYIDGATAAFQATGAGRATLKLEVPLLRPAETTVSGAYAFSNNQLVLEPGMPAFTQASGRVEFSEKALGLRGITAQLLGGPVTLNGASRGDGAVAITAQGTAAVRELRRMVDFTLLSRATGSAAWRGQVVARKGGIDMTVESDLRGVTVDAPPPVGKAAGEALAFKLERSNATDPDTAKRFFNVRPPARGDVWSLAVGRSVSGWLVRRRAAGDDTKMVFERGSIGLNEPPALTERAGLSINGELPYVDYDRWIALSGAGPDASSPGAAATPSAPPAADTLAIGSVALRARALDVGGKRLNEVVLRASSTGTAWTANIAARELEGAINWRPEGRGRIVARLKHFTVPDPAPGAAESGPPQRELPELDIVADSFHARERDLGKLELVAVNQARDWKIERLVLTTPESVLTADGVWQSWAARPSISLSFKLDVSDAGRYLDRFGFTGAAARGSASLSGKVGWAGNPQSVDYPTLTGNLVLSAEKGQFLRADPGIAKLLGILSLQSLITLDIRDLFREGFSYDTIAANAQITKGVMRTEDFRMRGAAASVSMNGSVDLAAETQSLQMRVVPALGDSASTIVALLLANPVAGIGALIAQRILKDPIGQALALDYRVTGSWTDPKVERTRTDVRGPDPERAGAAK